MSNYFELSAISFKCLEMHSNQVFPDATMSRRKDKIFMNHRTRTRKRSIIIISTKKLKSNNPIPALVNRKSIDNTFSFPFEGFGIFNQ